MVTFDVLQHLHFQLFHVNDCSRELVGSTKTKKQSGIDEEFEFLAPRRQNLCFFSLEKIIFSKIISLTNLIK